MKPLHVGLLAIAGLGVAYLALAPSAAAKILPPPQPPLPPPMPTPPTLVNAVVTVPRETVPNDQRGMLEKALGSIPANTPGTAAFLNVLITSEMGGLLVGKPVGFFLQIEGGGPGYWYLPVSAGEVVVTFPRAGVVASLQAPLLQTLPQTNPDAASFFTMKKGNVYSIIEKPFNPSTDPSTMPFPSAVYPSMSITEVGTGDVNRPDAPPPGARRVTGTFNGTGISPTSNYEDLKFLPPRTSGVYILAVIDVSAQNIQSAAPKGTVVPFSKI